MGYLELLRRYPHFRRLWLADVASLTGDWLNTLAIYALIRSMTDSPAALGLVFIAKLLPNVFVSPFAGLLVDRFDRRRLMIAADLIRAAVVCGFMFIGPGDWVGWVYVLAVAQVSVSAVFQPARSAATPNLVPGEALGTANALGAITWPPILVLGAGLGGVPGDIFGARIVFLLDAGTYLVSAVFVARTVIPQATEAGEGGIAAVLRGIREGVRYMLGHGSIGRIACAKGCWAIGAGAIYFMFTVIAPTLAPETPSTAIGVLYMAAGLGTGLGPVLLRTLIPQQQWPLALGFVMVGGGLAYTAVGLSPWAPPALALVVLATSAGGANWVISTVLLQARSEDRFRGRVFANELLIFTLCNSAAIGAASLLLEAGVEARTAVISFAAFQVAVGLAFGLWAYVSESGSEAEADSGG